MAEDTKLSQLIINELTKAQFEALGANVNEDEIYVITDDEVEIKTDGVTIVGKGTTTEPLSLSPDFSVATDEDLEALAENLQSQITANQTSIQNLNNTKIDNSTKGMANGVATLDNNAKVPMSQINDSLVGNVNYQGLYDASTNTPNLDEVSPKGHYYITSIGGTTSQGLNLEVGDWIISNGDSWDKVDNTDAVSSVQGRTGNVIITKEDFGLENVDNTADANKPVSTLQQAALDLKANKTDLDDYVKNTDIATDTKLGLIKSSSRTKFVVFPGTGEPVCTHIQNLSDFNKLDPNAFISKGTLETAKHQYVKQGVTENTITLSDSEKEMACNWLGASREVIQQTIMPKSAQKGAIIQYVGVTDSTYTNGYFYQYVALGEGYTTNATSNISTFDYDQFWTDVEAAGYTAENLGIDEKTKVDGGFRITGVMTSETVMTLQQINGVTVDFTTTAMTFSRGMGQRLAFYYYLADTYDWQRVDVQPTPEVDTLPSQADNAGKFLTTDGTTASWGDALVNEAESEDSVAVLGVATLQNSVSIGKNSKSARDSVAIGYNTDANSGGVAIGSGAEIKSSTVAYPQIAIGYNAKVQGTVFSAIQLGTGTNADANTFKVGNTNGNFELMSADGTIPAERMSATAGQTGQVLSKTETGMQWATLAAEHINITIGSETSTVKSAIEVINGKIPTAASSTNQLVDQATLNNAIESFEALPDKTNNAGKILSTDGTDAYWTDQYVAPTDIATNEKAGLVKVDAANGISINGFNTLAINQASVADIEAKTSQYNPITPAMLDYAVKAGILANSMQLSTEEKLAAQNWLGFGTITMRTWK